MMDREDSRPVLTIAVPTYKRIGRVEAILEAFKATHSASVELLISNNDFDVDLARYVEKADGDSRVRVINSEFPPGRIGNNMHNCLRNARGTYVVLMSDEDSLIGLDALVGWLQECGPDAFSVPLLDEERLARPAPASLRFVDVIAMNHAYLSGLGFRRAVIDERVTKILLSLTNNDYYHEFLLAWMLSRGMKYRYCTHAVVMKQVAPFERDYFVQRKNWFFAEGRFAQYHSAIEFAAELGEGYQELFRRHWRRTLEKCVHVSAEIYGVWRTVRACTQVGEHLLSIKVLGYRTWALDIYRCARHLLRGKSRLRASSAQNDSA